MLKQMETKLTGHYRYALRDWRFGLLICVLLLISFPALSEQGLSTKISSYSVKIFNRQLQQAQAGDATAQLETAQRFESGKGTERDIAQAFAWYYKAAEQGLSEAQYKLATMLEAGIGTKKNLPQAQRWYGKSAAQNYALAVARMAFLGNAQRKAKIKAAEKDKARQEARAQAALEAKHKAQQKAKAALATKRKDEQAAKSRRLAEQARRDRALQLQQQLAAEQQVKKQKQSVESEVAAIAKTIAARPDQQKTLDLLRQSNWLSSDVDVDFLPSPLSRCVRQGMQLSCFSQEREVLSEQSNVRYMAQSTVKVTAPGIVTISYRYQVTRVRDNNNRLEPHHGPNHPLPKKGWQNTFAYQCRLVINNALECHDGSNRRITFTRNTSTTAAR
ncbi:hypothetical protein MNBD_GAMMA13-343 [hydrothermal vent metagenome]|uniref:Uncharacterized protein n=1 Tax=hydrothermal vent metagenome TaxID=652676 RepID=A0A3B0YXJ8_9ZZZZ